MRVPSYVDILMSIRVPSSMREFEDCDRDDFEGFEGRQLWLLLWDGVRASSTWV
jgi:hypothetical protein